MTNQVSAIKLTYGYLELREYYYKAAKRAVTFAVSAHLLAISSYFISQFIFQEDEPVYTVRIMKYSDLGPPPSIENAEAAPRVNIAEPSAKPTVGIPIPVPDADINPEATIATQEELAAVSNDAVAEGVGSGEIKIEDEGPPADFVPVEKNPVPVNYSPDSIENQRTNNDMVGGESLYRGRCKRTACQVGTTPGGGVSQQRWNMDNCIIHRRTCKTEAGWIQG